MTNQEFQGQDPVLCEDLENLLQRLDLMTKLENKTVFITGATGLIGSQIVKLFASYNRSAKEKVRVIALARSLEKAQRILKDELDRQEIQLCVGDVNKNIQLEGDIDYIIHGASVTSSRSFVTNPVDTIVTAIDGTRNVLELAKEKQVSGFVYLSSLEVYGIPDKTEGFITESDYGYIDPLSVRSSYSEGKRMVEGLCIAYEKQYGVPVKIARLSQTFGAGVAYNDGRVFAEFARCAIEGKNIILHTEGKTIRSYCYTTDAIAAILYILLCGKTGEAYNVTNMDTVISIRDMAQLVCDLVPEKRINVEFDMPDDVAAYGFNPEMIIKLDSTKLMQLGWKPLISLDNMFKRLISSMAINQNV